MRRYRRLTALAAVSVLLLQHRLQAGGGPQNVALVVNSDDPESLGIANYYIELRQIPPSNVFYIPWRKDLAATTGVAFRDRLLKPLLAQIDERGLTDQIEIIAFSSGYPFIINCTMLFPGQQFPSQARPLASLTAAGFYYQHVLEGDAGMFGMSPHGYFAPTNGGATNTQAFSAYRESAPAAGRRKHLLCTALGVTFGRGNDAGEITASLRRAKEADGMQHRGTVYYMQNDDVRSKVRHGEFPAAAKQLESIGVNAEIMPGVVPRAKQDVAGLTTGSPFVELASANCKLLPGALVDNLTSAGGQMKLRDEVKPQTRISQYIRLGAAGASGTVIEPYAIPQKFPSPALHVHYARGCSLAEAYYQAVAAPFHLLIIGDPLCHPWASEPDVQVVGGAEGAPLRGQVSLTPTATFPRGRQAGRFELYIDGRRRQTIRPQAEFSIDTTKLADGWHDLRVVAIDDTPIEVQGAHIWQVQIQNGDGRLELDHDEPIRAALDSTITLAVTSTENADAHIMHNGRSLGVVAGGSGSVAFEASLLGQGRTTVYAEQQVAAGLRSKPVTIEVR